jgi:quercetin dioxygenase-like cupin family protein
VHQSDARLLTYGIQRTEVLRSRAYHGGFMATKLGAIAFGTVTAIGMAAHAKPSATFVTAGDLKWADVPDHPGVHIAAAEGDPKKGASHFFVKFDKGVAAPEHHHTADHFATVVSGTLVLTVDGKDTTLTAGTYCSFKGKKPHATKCDAAADCVLEIDARGKWDVIPEKKAEAKPAK